MSELNQLRENKDRELQSKQELEDNQAEMKAYLKKSKIVLRSLDPSKQALQVTIQYLKTFSKHAFIFVSPVVKYIFMQYFGSYIHYMYVYACYTLAPISNVFFKAPVIFQLSFFHLSIDSSYPSKYLRF